jgi:hypothetical protein
MAPLSIHTPFTFRTILIYGVSLLFTVIFVLYILFQARFLIAGPEISLLESLPNPQVSRVVYLEGTARNIVRMTLNGRQIYTDSGGYFKEEVILENGYTIVTLQAEDRYGRKHTQTREFVFYQDAREE